MLVLGRWYKGVVISVVDSGRMQALRVFCSVESVENPSLLGCTGLSFLAQL